MLSCKDFTLTTMENHYTDKISDYVLGMLDSADIPHLEKHAQCCETCRTAIAQERQLLAQISATFTVMPQPTHARLMRLMPAPPTARRTFNQAWQRAVTVMAMAIFLLIGGFTLRPNGSTPIIASPAPSMVALTATVTTAAPTSTPTQLAQGVFVTPVPKPDGY